MARFTRRYPQLLDPLLKQMLGMVAVRSPHAQAARMCCDRSPADKAQGPPHSHAKPGGHGGRRPVMHLLQARREAVLQGHAPGVPMMPAEHRLSKRLQGRSRAGRTLRPSWRPRRSPRLRRSPRRRPRARPAWRRRRRATRTMTRTPSRTTALARPRRPSGRCARMTDRHWPGPPSAWCIGAAPVGVPGDAPPSLA